MDADVLAERILLDLKNTFKKDPLIDEFDILPMHESVCNKCPVIHVEHKVALESWCVKHVYIHAYSNFFKWRKHPYQIDHDTLLSWTSAILLINPEIETVWNARKELSGKNVLQPAVDLKFSEIVLSRKPKSSQVFAHRKWVLLELRKRQLPLCSLQQIIEHELALCTRVANLYPNNYYAWCHRSWLIQEFLSTCFKALSEELVRMEHWISTHISDYSGFHYRQFLLSRLRDSKSRQSPHLSEDSKDTDVHYAVTLLQRELKLLTDLQNSFPGHETLWDHRRYVLREFCSVALSSCADGKPTADRCLETDGVARCKRHKPMECDGLCASDDKNGYYWNAWEESKFLDQRAKLAKNNDWERKLVAKHTTWLRNVLAWTISCDLS